MYVQFSIFPVDQISEFKAWQRAWREANLGEIEMKKIRLAAGDMKVSEAKKKIRVSEVEEVAHAVTPTWSTVSVSNKSDILRW